MDTEGGGRDAADSGSLQVQGQVRMQTCLSCSKCQAEFLSLTKEEAVSLESPQRGWAESWRYGPLRLGNEANLCHSFIQYLLSVCYKPDQRTG